MVGREWGVAQMRTGLLAVRKESGGRGVVAQPYECTKKLLKVCTV